MIPKLVVVGQFSPHVRGYTSVVTITPVFTAGSWLDWVVKSKPFTLKKLITFDIKPDKDKFYIKIIVFDKI